MLELCFERQGLYFTALQQGCQEIQCKGGWGFPSVLRLESPTWHSWWDASCRQRQGEREGKDHVPVCKQMRSYTWTATRNETKEQSTFHLKKKSDTTHRWGTSAEIKEPNKHQKYIRSIFRNLLKCTQICHKNSWTPLYFNNRFILRNITWH